jgi:hypothetical protein
VKFLLLAIALAGCGGDNSLGPLQLSWKFVDGRSCTDAGVSRIALSVGSGTPVLLDCVGGFAPASTMVMAPHSGTLTVAALSPQMATLYPMPKTDLYEGSLGLDEALLPATVTLYATASR